MTWLGKILAVCAMVLALVWMWFTATVYVTRTNWKNQAELYKDAYAKAREAREGEYRVYQAEKDALARQVKDANERVKGLDAQIADLGKANADYNKQIATLNATIKDYDVQAKQLQANSQSLLDESNQTRTRATALEEEKVRLTVAKADAEKAQQAAEIAMRQAQLARDKADALVQGLRGRLAQAEANGGRGSGVALTPPVAPLPEGFRGSVELYNDKEGSLVLSVGFEAGLSEGSKVDVSRIAGANSKYLGTATVTRVEPKRAVATFNPASGRRPAQLRPDEQPKIGDTVTAGRS